MSKPRLHQSTGGLPEPLPEFQHIKRYWDRQRELPVAKILPGEYYVSCHNEMITTVLGSCVSACIRDPAFGIGGMNHFMLPSDKAGHWTGTNLSEATRYGNYAMEHLINEILKQGGRREHLEIKVFGGGRVLGTMTDVGRRNIEFVKDYLRTEGFAVAAADVGDIHPRKVNYFPATGRAQMKKLRTLHNDTIAKRERDYMQQLETTPVAGEVDLW